MIAVLNEQQPANIPEKNFRRRCQQKRLIKIVGCSELMNEELRHGQVAK